MNTDSVTRAQLAQYFSRHEQRIRDNVDAGFPVAERSTKYSCTEIGEIHANQVFEDIRKGFASAASANSAVKPV